LITKNDILESGIFDVKIFPAFSDDFAQCTGENRKGLLLVLNQEPEPGLLAFLEKVLKAVHHDRNTDALTIFLTGDQRFSFSGFAQKHGIQKALFFGLTPARAGLNISPRPYLPSSLGERVLLFADDLSAIEQDKKLKAQLWEALQLMFPKDS
jgi:hypothetical protein